MTTKTYRYFITESAEFNGYEFIPVIRIYNAAIISDPENYKLNAGERFSNEKPIGDNVIIDFTIK